MFTTVFLRVLCFLRNFLIESFILARSLSLKDGLLGFLGLGFLSLPLLKNAPPRPEDLSFDFLSSSSKKSFKGILFKILFFLSSK